jgi:hypothetical protein
MVRSGRGRKVVVCWAGWGSRHSTAESGNGEVWAGEEGGGVGQDG